jgi:hypothetical protein
MKMIAATLALALSLAATPVVAQDEVPPEFVAIYRHTERLCTELGRKPGSAMFDECVRSRVGMAWARYQIGQIGPVPVAPAAPIAPRIIVPPANSGQVYVREAPRTCIVSGNVVTCQ